MHSLSFRCLVPLFILAGCSASVAEPTDGNGEALKKKPPICTIDSDGNPTPPGCAEDPGTPDIPPVSYLTIDVTRTTAVLDFMTQNKPERTWANVIEVGTVIRSAPQIDNAPSTRHTLTFVGLNACTTYEYEIGFLDASLSLGPFQASGTFSTTCQ